MMHRDLSAIRLTSVTVRSALRSRLQQASRFLQDRQLPFSEQRLLRECLRLALKFWRGQKNIAGRNRKYNKRVGPYTRMPFYSSEALRSVAHARCHHAGISLSRLVDFAISVYLPRVMEYWLRFEYRHRDKADVALWRRKYEQRRNRSEFIITYKADTLKNDGVILEFTEKSEILPWPPPEIRAA